MIVYNLQKRRSLIHKSENNSGKSKITQKKGKWKDAKKENTIENCVCQPYHIVPPHPS